MAGRPPREYEVKGLLLRLQPALLERIQLCGSILDVQTRQRLPLNTRIADALQAWCDRIEGQRTPVLHPPVQPQSEVSSSIPHPLQPTPLPIPVIQDVRQDEIPSFDTEKYHLGALCERQHVHGSTGKTLRNKRRACPLCEAEKHREKRAAMKKEVSA